MASVNRINKQDAQSPTSDDSKLTADSRKSHRKKTSFRAYYHSPIGMKVPFPGLLQLMAATSVFSICTLIYGQKLRHKKSAKLRSDNSMENENDIAILSSSEMTSTTQDGTLGDGLISNNLQAHPGEHLIQKAHITENPKSWISRLTCIFFKMSEADSTRDTFIHSQLCHYQGMNINWNQNSRSKSKILCSQCPPNIQKPGLTDVHRFTTDDVQEIIKILPSEEGNNSLLLATANNDHKLLLKEHQPFGHSKRFSTDDNVRSEIIQQIAEFSECDPPLSEPENDSSSTKNIHTSENRFENVAKIEQTLYSLSNDKSNVDLETVADDRQDNTSTFKVDAKNTSVVENYEDAIPSNAMYFGLSKRHYQFTGYMELPEWNDRIRWHQRSFSPIPEEPGEDNIDEKTDSENLSMDSTVYFSSNSASTSSSDLIYETIFSTSRGAEMNDNDLIDLQDDPDFQSLILQDNEYDVDDYIQSRCLEEYDDETLSQISGDDTKSKTVMGTSENCFASLETLAKRVAECIIVQAKYGALPRIMANRKPRTTTTTNNNNKMNVYQNRNSLTSSRIEIHVSHMASNLPKESLSAGELQVSGKKCCICQNSKTILHQRKREFFPSLSIKPKMRFTSGTLFQNRRLKLRRHTFFKRSCRSNVLRSRKLRLRHQRTAKSLCFDIKQALTTTMAQGFCLDRRLQQTKLVGRPIMDTQKQLFIPSRVSKETEIKSIWHSKRKLKKPFQRFRPETFSKLPTVLKYNVVKPSVNMTDLGGEVCHHIRDTGIRVRHTRSEPQKSYVTTISNDEEALMGLVLAQSLKEVKTDKKISAVVGSGVSPMLRQLLTDVFDHVYLTSEFCSYDDIALSLMGRPELGATFTKLHCWRLTQFQKCVYLDADTLVLENCDELFEREELSAVPDTGWPDCFNSGVFVFQPSLETYAKLVSLATTQGSFDGGDQGLLNTYFSNWRSDLSRRLPFIYNMMSNVSYTYAPAYKYYGHNAKIVHFLGSDKPWMVRWRTDTGDTGREECHPWDLNLSVLNRWIDIFRTIVLPKLPEVAQLLTHYSTSVTVAQILQKIYSKEIKEDETKSIWNRGDSLLQQYFPSHYNDEIHLPPPPVQPPVHLSHYETIPSQTSHDTTPSSHMRPQSPPSYQDHHRDTGTASFQKEPSPVSLPPPSPSPRAPSPISLASQSTETNPHSFDTSYNNFPEEAKETSEQSTRTSHSPLTISIIEEPSDPHWEALLWHSVQNPWVPPSPPPSTYDLPPSQQSQPLPNLKPTFGWFSDDSGANLEWNSFQFNQPSVEEERTSEKVSFRSEFNETSAKHVEQLILADVTKPPSECEVESLTSSHVTIQSHEQQPSLPAIQIGDSAPEEVEFAASSISGRDKDTETEAEQNLIERVEESEDSEADEAVPEQSSLQRMRQWEEGNIDYLGKDRFDNILMKLQLMLYSPQPSLEGEEPFEESLTENPTHEETEVGSSASSFIEDEKGDEPSTPEKSELEESEDLWLGYPEGDFTGMMNWQEGKIDYCGRDRSDNIIRRLDEIISGSKLASTS